MRLGWRAVLGAIALMDAFTTSARSEAFRCPHVGGDLVFGQATAPETLDPMVSTSPQVRTIALNLFEALLTRDENGHPILGLAAAMLESSDHLTYRFKLRPGVRFHNGKRLTAADVAASFDRYARIGALRGTLENVDHWDTPDAGTFVIHMKRAQPTFLQALSSDIAPIVIIPAEQRDRPAFRLTDLLGTGPFMLAGSDPGRFVKLRRFDGYQPNADFQQRTGWGGYKQACLDTVTFRVITDAQERAAALRRHELQGAEDLPPGAQLGGATVFKLQNAWMPVAVFNLSAPPTDSLPRRQAIEAALDAGQIMRAVASDNAYRVQTEFRSLDHAASDVEPAHADEPKAAPADLKQAGDDRPSVVVTLDPGAPPLPNFVPAVQQALIRAGIAVRIQTPEVPGAAQPTKAGDPDWNLMLTAWQAPVGSDLLDVMQRFVPPQAIEHPAAGRDDTDLQSAWDDMNRLPTLQGRQLAFGRMQQIVLQQGYALPFGVFGTVQAVRSNVQGFTPSVVPRLANVWLDR